MEETFCLVTVAVVSRMRGDMSHEKKDRYVTCIVKDFLAFSASYTSDVMCAELVVLAWD